MTTIKEKTENISQSLLFNIQLFTNIFMLLNKTINYCFNSSVVINHTYHESSLSQELSTARFFFCSYQIIKLELSICITSYKHSLFSISHLIL